MDMRMIANGETPTTQEIGTEREALSVIGAALGKMPVTHAEWTFLHIVGYDITFPRDLDLESDLYGMLTNPEHANYRTINFRDSRDEVIKRLAPDPVDEYLYSIFWRVVHAFGYSGVEY
jgi:hypothetical protein